MKRWAIDLLIFVFIIIGCLLIFVGVSKAADFSDMTDEELVQVYNAIGQELSDRQIEKTAHLTSGKYIGGIDIPEGEYLLTINNSDGQDNVILKYRCSSDSLKSTSGKVTSGNTFQFYITIGKDDILSVSGNFDLTIKPRTFVIFE